MIIETFIIHKNNTNVSRLIEENDRSINVSDVSVFSYYIRSVDLSLRARFLSSVFVAGEYHLATIIRPNYKARSYLSSVKIKALMNIFA